MITLIIKLLISAIAIFSTAQFLPGIHVADYKIALLIAVVLGILNVTLRPILKLISFPITILTLGFFAFIVNGFVFWLTARLIDGFAIDTFWLAVIGAVIVSLVTSILDRILLGSDGKFGSENN